MRVSLAQPHLRRRPTPGWAPDSLPSLLAPRSARVALGGNVDEQGMARPIALGPETLFGPRGAVLAHAAGPLFVCDTGHHRLLVWKRAPEADHTPADFVVGQPDFGREGRNAKGEIGAVTPNVPTDICAAADVLAVADAWNHCVLLWFGYPEVSNRPADVGVGQANFHAGLANRGSEAPRADTLNWCYGVAIADGRLIVADTGNRRVLVWSEVSQSNGAPADLVLGQRDMSTRDENAGEGAGALGMRWPHAVAVAAGVIFVADAGNNRVMAWLAWPIADGAPCEYVRGQADATRLDHNRGAYYPATGAMNMPYGLCAQDDRLIVADTANSRLPGFDLRDLRMDASALRLAGQPDFTRKGDNRWAPAARDSLCWPYGVAACGSTVAIADSGNNGVLLWGAAQ